MIIGQSGIGVIVGRFQVNQLHDEHINLFNHVLSKHHHVLVFLGVSPVKLSKRNPLNFNTRKRMLESKFENSITVSYIDDVGNPIIWSKTLDERIKQFFTDASITLYGSRDSFLHHYTGIFNKEEISSRTVVSGTDIRHLISTEIRDSSDFRAGIIYANYNRYAISYQTVDVAIFNQHTQQLLLSKKPNETGYRFVGGFVDTTDLTLEHAAIREAKEETDLHCVNARYLGSYRVDDWRYRNEFDKILTTLFYAEYTDQTPVASDDISEVKLFDLSELNFDMFVDTHKPLFNLLLTALTI